MANSVAGLPVRNGLGEAALRPPKSNITSRLGFYLERTLKNSIHPTQQANCRARALLMGVCCLGGGGWGWVGHVFRSVHWCPPKSNITSQLGICGRMARGEHYPRPAQYARSKFEGQGSSIVGRAAYCGVNLDLKTFKCVCTNKNAVTVAE